MADLVAAFGHALWMAFAMFWEILWPLILGFGLSGLVQAVVSKREMVKLLPNDSPKSLAIASGLGAASSSCSYAAVALARSIFRKGADFTATMAFELASTNLVAELSIILIVLMGWQFALAEFTGGPLIVAIMAVLFRVFLSRKLVNEARKQADRGVKGKMEGHAEMDMSLENGSLWQRITSSEGITATSHYFVMDWLAVWKDIAGGLLIAGALAAWVPELLERFLSQFAPRCINHLGTDSRAARCGTFVCLLGRKYPARRSSLEWRDQFWRRNRVHLRRPHCAPDHRHLSEVLWLESHCIDRRCILHRDGFSRVDRRVSFQSSAVDSAASERPDRRDHNQS